MLQLPTLQLRLKVHQSYFRPLLHLLRLLMSQCSLVLPPRRRCAKTMTCLWKWPIDSPIGQNAVENNAKRAILSYVTCHVKPAVNKTHLYCSVMVQRGVSWNPLHSPVYVDRQPQHKRSVEASQRKAQERMGENSRHNVMGRKRSRRRRSWRAPVSVSLYFIFSRVEEECTVVHILN